ncbi:MAG: hypothetical protein WC476_00735 [Phycisphaerae bacterium]|jgi:hypothetical protein
MSARWELKATLTIRITQGDRGCIGIPSEKQATKKYGKAAKQIVGF